MLRTQNPKTTQTQFGRPIRSANDRGQATVEFALILPLLLLLILGMLDFGRAFSYWIDETHLANETARWAAVNVLPDPADATCTAASNPLACEIKKQAETADLRNGSSGTGSVSSPGICFTFSFPASTGPGTPPTPQAGDPVKVDVTANYNWLRLLALNVPGLGATKSITGSATMRLEQTPTSAVLGTTPTTQAC
jgi:Flp pilus assembly protein TadG